ncbi:PAS domain-containing protein [Dictyobacter alpinus]|nr:PAS domain-containing protein [Dictyobacter alpinus]
MNESQIQLALEASNVGLWQLDLGTQQFLATEHWKQVYGLSPDAPVTFERFLSMIHPDDRERFEAVNTRAHADPTISYDVQFRIIQPDGSVRWVISRLQYLVDVPNQSGLMIGSALDITEVKKAQEQVVEILEGRNHC